MVCEGQGLVFSSEGDAHFHEEGTKGRPYTGPSSEIILGSSESLIDLINSHLLAATLCQELWWGAGMCHTFVPVSKGMCPTLYVM